ncbi:MAG: DUF4287 domain-containing protein [Maricaulis sp.]|uniref:DUF4287 domain-containing protein n=1 Tax=Maricaulis sp. TaxID=1486257 RepID=UPI001B0A1254|nr:DUF4287 domain-containing protein [Maricaulis sp.]MBO6729988.1 DUF4287 domain-containing protein [Maricaulis sp.]MBO6846371.1 DUF4287 domain-containing protein [Maricaulis sp.]MBO6876602.1 DUF4287 domain-containing protein [Maricaulis sp.]
MSTDNKPSPLDNMIANMPEKTGKSLQEWVALLGPVGARKHGELMKVLKGEHGLTHGYANLVAHTARDSMPSNDTADDPVAAQYAGKETLKPVYDRLVELMQAFGDDVEIAPKKAYVSLRRAKQFALIQTTTKTRVDVVIKRRDVDPGYRLEASGSFNSMVTHRVRTAHVNDIDDELKAWLKAAYDKAG